MNPVSWALLGADFVLVVWLVAFDLGRKVERAWWLLRVFEIQPPAWLSRWFGDE